MKAPHASQHLQFMQKWGEPHNEPCQVLTAHPWLPVSIWGACELQPPGSQPWSLITMQTCCLHLILSLPGSFFSLHRSTISLSCARTNATAGAPFSQCPSRCGHLPCPASFLGLHWHGNCTAAAPDWQECLIQGSIPAECQSMLFFPVRW